MEVRFTFSVPVFTSSSTVCCDMQLFLQGAELLVQPLGPGVGAQEKENPNIFLVGASRQRLLSGAEDVGLFKECSDGSMRAFTCAHRHNFKDFKGKEGEKPNRSTARPSPD